MNKYIGKKYETREGQRSAEIVGEGFRFDRGYSILAVLTNKATGKQVAATYADRGRGCLQFLIGENHELDLIEVKPEAEFTCNFCGRPSNVDPSDQTAPADQCHEGDHGGYTTETTTDAPVIPFGIGHVLITGCVIDGKHGIAIEVTDEPGQVGQAAQRGDSEPDPCVILTFTGSEYRDTVYAALANQKRHAKLPDKPDCEAAFKKWYWEHGADFNANHVRPVWLAAQHAMYEALKEQMA